MPQHVQVIYQNKGPDNRIFTVPDRHKRYLPDRLASTPGDNIAEYAGKLCYDSLLNENGRKSAEYHAHIHEVGHRSVYAHAVETFAVDFRDISDGFLALAALQSRPGVWVTAMGANSFRVALSLRAVIEWDDHGPETLNADPGKWLGMALRFPLGNAFPCTLAALERAVYEVENPPKIWARNVSPQFDREQWVSLYISGVSRDLLQELVRHHYQANPSVRSTRYCDESDCETVLPPAVADSRHALAVSMACKTFSHQAYGNMLTAAKDLGLDKKAARGAARSCLTGATETELAFSLSKFQAKHILGLRVRPHADQEISDLADNMRAALKPVWGEL